MEGVQQTSENMAAETLAACTSRNEEFALAGEKHLTACLLIRNKQKLNSRKVFRKQAASQRFLKNFSKLHNSIFKEHLRNFAQSFCDEQQSS